MVFIIWRIAENKLNKYPIQEAHLGVDKLSLWATILRMCDAPQSSLMDSTASLKRKTTKRDGVGVRSLAGNISRVDGCAGVPRWD